MVWWHNKTTMEQARKALGNLDTPADLELVTFSGSTLSINKEAVRDEAGQVLFPPRDKEGRALPFFCQGELRRGGIYNGGLQEHKLFQHHRTTVDPQAFGLRDILRFADAPESQWYKYTGEPADYPECKSCEHAVAIDESPNGAQIKCKTGNRTGRFVACSPICMRQKIRLKSGEAKPLTVEETQALQASYKQEQERLAKNDQRRKEAAKEKAKPKATRRRKVPPLRRVQSKQAPEPVKQVADFKPPPPPPKPRQGDAPKPRRSRRVLKVNKKGGQ